MLLAAYKLNLFPCSITILQMVKASEFTLGMYYSSRQYKEAKALLDQMDILRYEKRLNDLKSMTD